LNVTIVPLNSLAVVLQGRHGGTMEMFLICFEVSHLGLSMSWNTELAGAVCQDYFLASFSRKLLYGTQQQKWSPAFINPSTKVKKVNALEQCLSTVIQFSALLALPSFSFNVQIKKCYFVHHAMKWQPLLIPSVWVHHRL
jgi:hypothetical protein